MADAEEISPEGGDDAGDGGLGNAGVSREDLALCVSVLERLAAAREKVDWGAKLFRPFRKALVPHCQETFGALPQKDSLDGKQKAKFEKNCKRERRQRQLNADRKWQENAELRASRLARLDSLEMPNPDDTQTLPLRIPDGPAQSLEPVVLDAAIADIAPEASLVPAAVETPADTVDDGAEYHKQQACYICKARFSERHQFYSHLCPPCASLNFSKRHQVHELHGRVCLVTGARVKIGFQTVLKLLRMGARVVATTRFPRDALHRYTAEADSAEWLERLIVHGLDFRFLGAVERFCSDLLEQEAHLDVIINNACQTIRRPAAYYSHLIEDGAADGSPNVFAPAARASIADDESRAARPEPDEGAGPLATPPARVAGGGSTSDSAMMSQLAVLAEDRMDAEAAAAVLPAGERDVHGQQLDTRATNSWLLKLGEVSTPEAVEVFCINALTPFVLNGRLRPLLERSPFSDRYIVNVSAMEGKFYRYKQPTHPHTNMAKAALNMMTRTSAEDYARKSGIFMNSVDTGWINDENPLPTARRIAADHGFQTPIDEVDAAARILDPVLTGMKTVAASPEPGAKGARRRRKMGAQCESHASFGAQAGDDEEPPWGNFVKDYVPIEW